MQMAEKIILAIIFVYSFGLLFQNVSSRWNVLVVQHFVLRRRTVRRKGDDSRTQERGSRHRQNYRGLNDFVIFRLNFGNNEVQA